MPGTELSSSIVADTHFTVSRPLPAAAITSGRYRLALDTGLCWSEKVKTALLLAEQAIKLVLADEQEGR